MTPVPPTPRSVLAIDRLSVDYRLPTGSENRAVAEASLTVGSGEFVALVGESGSGKSTLAKAVVGQLPASARIAAGSSISIGAQEIVGAPERTLRALRGAAIGFVPQDPRRGLHPLQRIGAQIVEALRAHRPLSRAAARVRAEQLLEQVGISEPRRRANQYPHEFSGGMLQRVLIAIAVAGEPRLIVADEPTSALDATVQRQILDLLRSLSSGQDRGLLLITHDLSVASRYSDTSYVMRHGRIIENGATSTVFEYPREEYTRALIRASPRIRRAEPVPARHVEVPNESVLLRAEAISRRVPARAEGSWRRTETTLVEDVSFALRRGSTLALVGESGAGKTTVGRLALDLDPLSDGEIVFAGDRLSAQDREARREFRRRTQLIPQSAAVTFDPRYTVAEVIGEPIRANGGSAAAAAGRVSLLLEEVGLPAAFADRSPLELSGGQQQRVAIARALSLEPHLLVCDEPTSALDVTVQATIVSLLRRLQREHDIGMLFISHDLALVSEIADEVVVLQHGRVVESGSTAAVLQQPLAEYTRELVAAAQPAPAP
ncbi:ATP-binding cassette domain-containing protein [Leucobacter celer]|uniref:ATP-binding cassette domain-containing protein n=1 Tax=Leucobacter celer TaxID=668625 RepID=UPI0006A77C14|nr:ABC transporter ATP-binding protein [Leucobacter celer]